MYGTDREGYFLVDGLDYGGTDNAFWCSCGEELYPDCDMSLVSVLETFEEHVSKAHGRAR